MGKHGGTLVIGCGDHELGVALDLPHVDPQPRVGVETDGAAGFAQQLTSLGALAVGVEDVQQMAQRDSQVLSRASFITFGPQCGRDLGPWRLIDDGQVEAELADAAALPGGVIDDSLVAPHRADTEEAHGRRCRAGHTPSCRQIGTVVRCGGWPSGERPLPGCAGGDRPIESGHLWARCRGCTDRGESLEQGDPPEGRPDRPAEHLVRFEKGSGRVGIVDVEQGLGHRRQRRALARQERTTSMDLYEEAIRLPLLARGSEQTGHPCLGELQSGRWPDARVAYETDSAASSNAPGGSPACQRAVDSRS